MAHFYVHIKDNFVGEKGILLDDVTQNDIYAPEITYNFETNRMSIRNCKANLSYIDKEEEFIIDFNDNFTFAKIRDSRNGDRIEKTDDTFSSEGEEYIYHLAYGYDVIIALQDEYQMTIIGFADDSYHYNLKEFFERRP